MSGQELCPLCGEGHVTASVQMLEYEYKGQKTQLPSHYRQCDVCTSDFAGMAEYKPWAQSREACRWGWSTANAQRKTPKQLAQAHR